MVKEEELNIIEELLNKFKRVLRKVNRLNQMNWELNIEIPEVNETITYDIPEDKKQAIIQEAIDKRNLLKQKVDSVDWTSLN